MDTDLTTHPTPDTVDLTGLPEPFVAEIKRLVQEARQRQAEEAALAATPAGERPPLIGRFAHLGWSFPKEVIDEAQRRAWANFPREFPEPPTQ